MYVDRISNLMEEKYKIMTFSNGLHQASLFNRISTFVTHLMPNPSLEKSSNVTI